MSRALNLARRAAGFLGHCIVVAAVVFLFFFLLVYALDDPIPHGPSLQSSDACFGH